MKTLYPSLYQINTRVWLTVLSLDSLSNSVNKLKGGKHEGKLVKYYSQP